MVFNIALKLGMADIPFIIRIWIVFMLCLVAAVVFSRFKTDEIEASHQLNLKEIAFSTSGLFNIMSAIVIAILVGLYAVLW